MLVKELMSLCWHQNPEIRPNMIQCKQWAASQEFVRLRAYFTLSDVTSVACACVSHIDLNKLPQQCSIEEVDMASHSEILQPQNIDKEKEEVVVVKEEKESKVKGNDWEIIQVAKSVADSATKSGGDSTGQEQLTTAAATPAAVAPVASKETARRIVDDKGIEEYTQMWMCGRDKKKGLFAAFLFPDNQKSNSVSALCCLSFDITIISHWFSHFWGLWVKRTFIQCVSYVIPFGWGQLLESCVFYMLQLLN